MKRESLNLNSSKDQLVWSISEKFARMENRVDVISLVTVVMPVFNGESTVERAIDSVLGQKDCRHELIVIDDGSTDSTPDILARYGSAITVITQQAKTVNGLGETRNRGASAGSGEWIAFIDADDYWHPEKLKSQLAAAAESSAQVVFCNARSVGSEQIRQIAYTHEGRSTDSAFRALLSDNFIFTSSVMVSKKAFLKVGGFTTQSGVVQDWDLWLRLAAEGFKFVGLLEVLIDYQWMANSVSKSHVTMRQRRLGAFSRAVECDAGKVLSPIQKLIARSCLEATSAWFLASDNPTRAALWYLRALYFWPLNTRALKGFVKSSLGRV